MTDESFAEYGYTARGIFVVDTDSGEVSLLSDNRTSPPWYLDSESVLVGHQNGTLRLDLATGEILGQRPGHVLAARSGSILYVEENFTVVSRGTWDGSRQVLFEGDPGCRIRSGAGINETTVSIAYQCNIENYQDHDSWRILLITEDSVTEGPAGSSSTLDSEGTLAYVTNEGIVVNESDEPTARVVANSSQDTRVSLPKLISPDVLYFLRVTLQYERLAGVHEWGWYPVQYDLVKVSLTDGTEEVVISLSKTYRMRNFDVAPDVSSIVLWR